MMKKTCLYILAAVGTLLLVACEHKELCYNHNEHAPKSHVRINASWEQKWQYDYEGNTHWSIHPAWGDSLGMDYKDLIPGIPTGLGIYNYHEDGSSDISNLPSSGGLAFLRQGVHSLLFYNNDTEYIVFDEIESYALAQATTRARSRSTYSGDSYTVNPPDMLYGSYMAEYTAKLTEEPDEIDVTLRPLVFTYLIRYEFSAGLKYVSVARGALSGMARSVFLNNGRTSPKEATLLYDCTMEDFGVQAVVKSFGVPDFSNDHYSSRSQGAYGLNLEVRLKNGKILNFDFDVTAQVQSQPQGGVIVVRGIEIPEAEGMEGSSGFDVDVEGWGEFEDVELPL